MEDLRFITGGMLNMSRNVFEDRNGSLLLFLSQLAAVVRIPVIPLIPMTTNKKGCLNDPTSLS